LGDSNTLKRLAEANSSKPRTLKHYPPDEIRRLLTPPVDGPPLVALHARRTGNAVPVLALKPNASLAQLEATKSSQEVAAGLDVEGSVSTAPEHS
jgi:hypothetical protein